MNLNEYSALYDDRVPLSVKGQTGQTTNLQERKERKNLSGTVLAKISSTGVATFTPDSTGWTTSNVRADKALDADVTNLAELADVLATMIDEVKNRGMSGG